MFEIGNSLREARVRQGLGYPEAELATKIRGKYIRALEEEDFDVLPSETYARGFLRAYADYLGLDGQLYVDEFGSRFGTAWKEDEARRQPARVHRHRGVERRAVGLALAGIAALVLLVFVAWRFGGSASSTPPVVSQQDTQKVTLRPVLVLRGVGRGAWVQVRRRGQAGKILLQATIPAGGVQRLTGSQFALVVRNSGNLRATIGGRPVALPAQRTLRVLVGVDQTTQLGK